MASVDTLKNVIGSLQAQIIAINETTRRLKEKKQEAEGVVEENVLDANAQARLTVVTNHLNDLEGQADYLQNQIKDLDQLKTSIQSRLVTPLRGHSPARKTPENISSVSFTPSLSNPVIKLKPPKPYKIGEDFDIFYELFRSFSEGEPYARQVQILKTLLTPEAYKISKHVFDDAYNLQELEKGLNSVFAKSTNLTSAIHAFRQIKQYKDENTEAFATRIRLCAAEAFPTCSQREREPYMIQMFVQGLNVSQQQKNLLSVTEHQTLSDTLLVAARLTDEPTEIHSVESQSKTEIKTCYYCKKPGHVAVECRTRLRHQHEQTNEVSAPSCNNCGGRHNTYTCRQPPKAEVICLLCQKRGHFSRQCRNAVNSNANYRPQCQLCQKPGHVALQCRTVKFSAAKSAPEPNFLPAQSPPNHTDALPSNSQFQGNGARLA